MARVEGEQHGDKGLVEFRARYRDDKGQEQVMHEKSVFQRSGGRWFYVGGEVSSAPACERVTPWPMKITGRLAAASRSTVAAGLPHKPLP